ncbi:hypothetical protein Efla_001878 [Eimeria flavescens]
MRAAHTRAMAVIDGTRWEVIRDTCADLALVSAALLSPSSEFKPWLSSDAARAHLAAHDLTPPRCKGVPPADLPQPFSYWVSPFGPGTWRPGATVLGPDGCRLFRGAPRTLVGRLAARPRPPRGARRASLRAPAFSSTNLFRRGSVHPDSVGNNRDRLRARDRAPGSRRVPEPRVQQDAGRLPPHPYLAELLPHHSWISGITAPPGDIAGPL